VLPGQGPLLFASSASSLARLRGPSRRAEARPRDATTSRAGHAGEQPGHPRGQDVVPVRLSPTSRGVQVRPGTGCRVVSRRRTRVLPRDDEDVPPPSCAARRRLTTAAVVRTAPGREHQGGRPLLGPQVQTRREPAARSATRFGPIWPVALTTAPGPDLEPPARFISSVHGPRPVNPPRRRAAPVNPGRGGQPARRSPRVRGPGPPRWSAGAGRPPWHSKYRKAAATRRPKARAWPPPPVRRSPERVGRPMFRPRRQRLVTRSARPGRRPGGAGRRPALYIGHRGPHPGAAPAGTGCRAPASGPPAPRAELPVLQVSAGPPCTSRDERPEVPAAKVVLLHQRHRQAPRRRVQRRCPTPVIPPADHQPRRNRVLRPSSIRLGRCGSAPRTSAPARWVAAAPVQVDGLVVQAGSGPKSWTTGFGASLAGAQADARTWLRADAGVTGR